MTLQLRITPTRPTARGVILGACLTSMVVAGAQEGYVVEKGRLPFVDQGDLNVTFTTSGAWVLSLRGKNLLGGGIAFRERGWRRWGTQLRRTSNDDSFEVLPSQTPSLAFVTSLKDLERKELFDLRQTVVREGPLLRIACKLTAREAIESEIFGGEFEIPVKEIHAQRLALRFGADFAKVPQHVSGTKLNQFIAGYKCKTFEVLEDGAPVVQIEVAPNTQWFLVDDRPFKLNVVRAQFLLTVPDGKIAEGQEFNISYSVHLREHVSKRVQTIGPYSVVAMNNGTVELRHPTLGNLTSLKSVARVNEVDGYLVPKLGRASVTDSARLVSSGQMESIAKDDEDDPVVIPFRFVASSDGKSVKVFSRFRADAVPDGFHTGILITSKKPPIPEPVSDVNVGEKIRRYLLVRTAKESIVLEYAIRDEESPNSGTGTGNMFVPIPLKSPVASKASDYVQAEYVLRSIPVSGT